MQLLGVEILNLREVEAFDRSGVNVALNKPATQSSISGGLTASVAVDGNVTIASGIFCHTNSEQGK